MIVSSKPLELELISIYVHRIRQKLSVFSSLSFLPLSTEEAHQLSHQTISPHILTPHSQIENKRRGWSGG